MESRPSVYVVVRVSPPSDLRLIKNVASRLATQLSYLQLIDDLPDIVAIPSIPTSISGHNSRVAQCKLRRLCSNSYKECIYVLTICTYSRSSITTFSFK